jgi:hypothetical protein
LDQSNLKAVLMEPLLLEIEAFCKANGLSETRFGELALGDKPFISQLRAGRDLRVSTVEKIRAFMSEYRRAA